MKRIIIICILCVLGYLKAYCQLLEDKVNFYVGFQNGLYLGNELFDDHGTISPSFYSNFKENKGLYLKSVFSLSPCLCTGLKLGIHTSSNWQNSNYQSYKGSKLATINFQPVIQIHNKFQKNGLLNRLKVYGEISPVVSFSTLNVENNLFDISGSDMKTDRFFCHYLLFGIETEVGCEYALTNKTGAFINLSEQESFINCPLFSDSKYSLIGFSIGIRINISKVKRFIY